MTEPKVEVDDLNTADMVAWRNLPQTHTFLKYLAGIVEDQKEMWLTGAFVGSNDHQNIVNNARAQGAAAQAQLISDAIRGITMPQPKESSENAE